METNRPRGREKNVTGETGSVHRRGEGLHTGPVGSGGRGSSGNGSFGYNGAPGSGGGVGGLRGNGQGRSPLITIIIVIAAMFLGGGGLGSFLLGGNGSGQQSSQSVGDLISMLGGGSGSTGGSGTSYGGWIDGDNTGKLNTEVASSAREKRTVIKGDGTDQITLMVYMCGADLESKSGMATKDLQEMTAATLSDNVNIIVFTGGASSWKNNVISNQVNQIYQVKNGGLRCLDNNAGTASMTDPNTLTQFIQYCKQKYSANRMDLIFWDHGGGSVSGYGYDEKNQKNGSMTLAGINQALKKAGVSFDFIGFDACLMATVENALMLEDYADYLIASEETEPGVGWYYTDWLTKLSKDSSMSTLEIGKNIVDDFVSVCAQKLAGQKTTLSIIDLAEAKATIPEVLSDFSKSTATLIKNENYQTVSNARYQTREFAQSSKIDQIDLVHFAKNVGTKEGDKLASVLRNAVKYNRTSSNMTNAYGLSIYFPCRKVGKVDSAVSTYSQIGMDEEYSRCIKAFASMEVSGQATSGGASSPLPSLTGSLGSLSGSSDSSDVIMQMIGSLISGQLGGVEGLTSGNTGFLSDKSIDTEAMAEYIADNHLDPSTLVWSKDSTSVLKLSEEEWSLVQDLELNVFFDDGEGYIDLGLDNVFEFDDDNDLIGNYDGTWLAINGQPVAYYYETTVDDGENYTITGHVPAMLNGERVNLMLIFDNEHPNGYVAGAVRVYDNDTTETIAKNMEELQAGDTLDFLCDYYSYNGTYQDSYYLGEQMTVDEQMTISNVKINGECSATYRITDIYQQHYWTEVIPK